MAEGRGPVLKARAVLHEEQAPRVYMPLAVLAAHMALPEHVANGALAVPVRFVKSTRVLGVQPESFEPALPPSHGQSHQHQEALVMLCVYPRWVMHLRAMNLKEVV